MPIEALAALRWAASSTLSLDVGAGRGLTTGYGVPEYRVLTGLRYTPRAAQPAVRMQPVPVPVPAVTASPAPSAPVVVAPVAEAPVAEAPEPEASAPAP